MRVHLKHIGKILLICLYLMGGTTPLAGEVVDTVVVVNLDVKERTLSLSTVRTILGMRLRSWGDGTPIKVYVLADDHPTHIGFSKQVLGMFPHQLRWAWDRLVFSGTGQAPTKVANEEEMRRRIATTPGAIGYLSKSFINGEIHELQIQ